jgi:ssDNA-binding Zn-finger/Zn-ribbon topoisomerase 1
MILRKNSKNNEIFWGCTNFPNCSFTYPWDETSKKQTEVPEQKIKIEEVKERVGEEPSEKDSIGKFIIIMIILVMIALLLVQMLLRL